VRFFWNPGCVVFISSSSVDSTTSFLLIICMNIIIMYVCVCVVHLHLRKWLWKDKM
jgi:hypothetical protein